MCIFVPVVWGLGGGFERLRIQEFCLGVFGLLFQKVLGVGLDLTLHSSWSR